MLDLSLVTDTLRQILSDALAANPLWGGGPAPFSLAVSGQHPEQPGSADCELNLYLFHIGADKFLANSFWSSQAQSGGGSGQQPVAFEPLCLDLWYLLSAQSKTSYVHEQQVLGVAMRAFHEHGTVKIAAPTPPPDPVSSERGEPGPGVTHVRRAQPPVAGPRAAVADHGAVSRQRRLPHRAGSARTAAAPRLLARYRRTRRPADGPGAAAPAGHQADGHLYRSLRRRGCRPPSRTSSPRPRPRPHQHPSPVRR